MYKWLLSLPTPPPPPPPHTHTQTINTVHLVYVGGGCFCSGQVEVGGNDSRKISRNSDVLYYKHLNYQVFESLLW